MLRTHYINELDQKLDGKEVTLCGWVHEVRNIGKIIFMLLRDKTGIVQVTAKEGLVSKELMRSMDLPKESVVMVKGIVSKSAEAKKGFEIIPKEVINLNPLSGKIPFEVTGKVPAELDVRLEYRYIDLRRLETSAIFKIESTMLQAFRNTLLKEGFTEIRTPSIVAAATEGGTDLFPVTYFEKVAYLSQSPQLYKQLAVIGGFDKVFMIVPVFRAEKHNTTEHLNEITQMDIEMGFADHNDAIRMLKKVGLSIIKEVKKRNAEELETLGVSLDIPKPVEVKYKDVVKKINENGLHIEFGEDLKREHEVLLAKLYGDFVILKEYPTKVRAFYTMPNEKDPEVSNSFDLIYKGLEVSSGAQRIHIPQLLEEAIRKRGMDPKNFEFYINAFRHGAPPHAGWSIGLERFAMKITNMPNIRECSLFPRDRTRVTP
ncbi:MAG: aspartate--tRNA(Asn) ligase [Candidatus Micrarchaeota archaeon]